MNPFFCLSNTPDASILELLESVTLGTNGAKYKHLDTDWRICEADHPLFLTLKRREKVKGNVTFCRREGAWYIRYFAFANELQSGGIQRSSGGGSLKAYLQQFFDDLIINGYDNEQVSCFYAYIDPKNKKSLWMSENFQFKQCATLSTQTFSRRWPRKLENLQRIEKLSPELKDLILDHFGSYRYFTDAHLNKGPFYVLRDQHNEILAFTKIERAHWRIVRLPGRLGGFTVRCIPYIPILNSLVKPACHTFLVPEAVYLKNKDPRLLERFFSGILHQENVKVITWWVDVQEETYKSIKTSVDWGMLHKIIRVNEVQVVQRGATQNSGNPVYTCAFDFI